MTCPCGQPLTTWQLSSALTTCVTCHLKAMGVLTQAERAALGQQMVYQINILNQGDGVSDS